ncbi:DUF2878 domain-containing protein [Paraglaciecola sp.]|uniref:DUF2878 domain-containing protein n=1 Tax=Paraglaciecola sp. TaxID=1920173 RepID=UPI003EF0C202
MLNIIGFNLSWFGLILFGHWFIPVTAVWLAFHLYACDSRKVEAKLILSVTLLGTLIDSTLLNVGILIIEDHVIIPLWFIMLWAVFTSTIRHSLQFLKHSYVLQFVVGFCTAPLSYLGGASLSPIELGYSQVNTFLIIGLIWGVLMIGIFALQKRFEAQENYRV